MASVSRSLLGPRRWRRVLLMVCALLCLCTVALAEERSAEAPQSDHEPASSEAKRSHDDSDIGGSSRQEDAASTQSAGPIDKKPTHTHDPVVAFEIRTSDYEGDIVWEQPRNPSHAPTDSTSSDHRQMPTFAEREEFIRRMQATLDTLLARFEEQGTHVLEGEQQTIDELRVLIEQAAPLLTSELLQELPELYEQLVDAQTVAEDILDESDPEIPQEDKQDALVRDIQPSSAFVDIEDRILADGLEQEYVHALEKLAKDTNDVYAHETLAYIELFEPNATHDRDFSRAFEHLRVAADARRGVASSLLAMLSLIDFGVPRNASLPVEERRQIAEEFLLDLSQWQDFTASLVVGYRMLTGEMTGAWRHDKCQNAVQYYYRCAESNVNQIAEMGGERSHDLARLSDEMVAPGVLNDHLHDDALQQYEYFRSIAANPMDEQWLEATERLGEMYFYGDEAAGVRQDFAQATDHFRRAAEGGDALAQANYGMMLAQGIGTKQDNITALRFFEKAAAQGNGYAMHGIGLMYLAGGGVRKNETRAFEWFQQAVEFGYIEAHTYLGSAYLHGRGVARNETLAFDHFSEAATTQSSQAIFNLGVMYYRGAGTKWSCPAAVAHFRQVATQPALLADLPFSMEKAYDCYKQGDYLRAYLQYRLLSEMGSEEAQTNAAFILEQFGDGIFASVAGADGTDRSGDLPLVWMGEPKRPMAEALALYERAAALNDTEAIRKTGTCHYEGWPNACEKNATRAIRRFEKAARLGDSEAAFNCGTMYTTADGVERDLEAAKQFFSMCADAMFPENVPCAVALAALNLVVSMRGVVESAVALAPQPLRTLLAL